MSPSAISKSTVLQQKSSIRAIPGGIGDPGDAGITPWKASSIGPENRDRITDPGNTLTTSHVSASLPVHKETISMANSKSAAKRARQSPRRTLRNRSVVTHLRSLTKQNAAAGGKDRRALVSALDKAAKLGVIHKNMANRRKARLNLAAAKVSA